MTSMTLRKNRARTIRTASPSRQDAFAARRSKPDDPPAPPPDCAVLRAGMPFIGRHGLSHAPAISAETVGASGIHMQVLTIPPGARARAHKHKTHETAIYVLSGEAAMHYGERLENCAVTRAGDLIYIPANVPHLPYNLSETEPCVAVVARTDAQEHESVVWLPRLDALHD